MRRSKRWLATLVAVSAWVAGCYRAAPQSPPIVAVTTAATPDIDREIARAATVNKPLLVVVAESGKSPEDDAILPVPIRHEIVRRVDVIHTVSEDESHRPLTPLW